MKQNVRKDFTAGTGSELVRTTATNLANCRC